MGIQHEGAHARVFRGVDGNRKLVKLNKRTVDLNDNLHRFIHVAEHNTNHGNAKMNVPDGYDDSKLDITLANKDVVESDVETVYSVVYATASQTFSGTPASYSTETAASVTATNVAQSGATTTSSAAAATTTSNADEASYESAKSAAQAVSSSSSSTATYPTRQAVPNATTSSSSSSASAYVTRQQSPNTASSSVSDASTTTSASLYGNAVGGTPLSATRTPQESNSGMTGGAKAGLAIGILLGLGLLAGLAFFCYRRRKNPKSEEFNEKINEKSAPPVQTNRFSADSDKSSIRSSNTPATAPRLSLRPMTHFLPNLTNNNQNNPAMTEKASAWERREQNPAQNPFGDAAVTSEKQANPFDEGDGHDRNNSMSSTNSGDSKAGAAVPAAARGPNNVHRVQLDFKPSMEDELELISGQLVRMLHEYDDGWALCIRMDRTQQGVVPRTCLSKLPVKPRGPPQGRPQGPPSAGMPSPPSTADANTPRPLTPTRAPAPEAVPARKPVPGQAL